MRGLVLVIAVAVSGCEPGEPCPLLACPAPLNVRIDRGDGFAADSYSVELELEGEELVFDCQREGEALRCDAGENWYVTSDGDSMWFELLRAPATGGAKALRISIADGGGADFSYDEDVEFVEGPLDPARECLGDCVVAGDLGLDW